MPKQGRNRKLLLYAGAVGAVFALIVLIKRKQAPAGEGAEASGPTYASAPGGIPAIGETTADSASALKNELASWEQAIQAQLPGAIESGVKAGLANNQQLNQPQQLTGNGSLAEIIAALGTYTSSVTASRTGEQTGAGVPGSPSSGAPAVVPSVSPAAPPPPAPAPAPAPAASPPPAPKPGYTIIRCGNGCEGHRYPDGRVACQIKDSHGHCHWP